MRRRASPLVMMRGRPKTLQPGSSGWMAIFTSYFSQMGKMASRKYFKLAHRASSSTDLYTWNSSWMWARRSGSHPGSRCPWEPASMEANSFSGSILSISRWS